MAEEEAISGPSPHVANPLATYKSSTTNNKKVRKRKNKSNSTNEEMESAPKKKRTLKSFEQRIDDLRAYKEKHGQIIVS